ncbi:MAG: hydrogenase maturation nickel metallochaperone HypA [Propionibacteriaceae bacterium]|nr:hydrogenase maturation nickel metallochaperone HypA [Propionibacteriaceae bacterium]
MHELGLLRGVVKAAVAAVAGKPGAIAAVGLRVGTLSGAVPQALEGAWPLAIAGTRLESARLEIEPVPAAVYCPACQAEQPIDEFFALACPVCAAPTGALARGREFQLAYVDLE